MSWLLAGLVVIAFAVLLERLPLASRARTVADRACKTLETLRDSQLDDETKERTLQRNAVGLFGLAAAIIGLSLLALLLPLVMVWLLDRAGLASMSEVLAVLQRADFLVAATIVGASTYLLSRTVARR